MKSLIALLGSWAATVLLSFGCTQMPTEKQGVSDLRPQISFNVGDEQKRAARVIIDGLDMGRVGDYVSGTAALRVLPGSHVLRVTLNEQTIVEEKFYVGDGVSRTFTVK